MKVTFWHSDKPRERILADAFQAGVRAHGDEIELRALQAHVEVAQCDIAVMVGVKSRELFRAHWQAGVHTLMLDKGYVRSAIAGPVKQWEYWRTAVDAHHPTNKLMEIARPFDRIEKLHGITLSPWRKEGGHIVFAGSSAKYHEFYGLKEPTTYGRKVVSRLRELTQREIVYRPKPSWHDAVPLDGTRYSSGERQIEQELQGAWALVTHGSNACFEAVCRGIPCIVLGDAVAKPISSQALEEIESPRLCKPSERAQWMANLAYCQWTQKEFATGEAWGYIRPQVYG